MAVETNQADVIKTLEAEKNALRNQVYNYRLLTELVTACSTPFANCKECKAKVSRERSRSTKLLFPKG